MVDNGPIPVTGRIRKASLHERAEVTLPENSRRLQTSGVVTRSWSLKYWPSAQLPEHAGKLLQLTGLVGCRIFAQKPTTLSHDSSLVGRADRRSWHRRCQQS